MAKKYQDKRMNIMVDKVGLSESDALWCLETSKKYSIWLANQLKVENRIKNMTNVITMILDWKRDVQNINLNELSFYEARKLAEAYQKSFFVDVSNGLKNTNVVLDCGDYKWVQLLSDKDCKEEGSYMGHCIGGDNHVKNISSGNSIAFSLRDKYNKPHITLEARSNSKSIFEFKGASNQVPKAVYMKHFTALLKKYEFSGVTDYNGLEAFKSVPSVVEKINGVNNNFFDFNFKLSLGIIPFTDGEIFMSEIVIDGRDLDKDLNLGNSTSFYARVSLIGENIIIQDDVMIGGDLEVNCKNIQLGKNIKVAGNVFIETKTKKEEKRVKSLVKRNLSAFGMIEISCVKDKNK